MPNVSYLEWKIDMQWFDELSGKRYIQTATKEINMCLVLLKGMDDIEIRSLIYSIISGMQEAIDKIKLNMGYKGFDLGILASDEVNNEITGWFEFKIYSEHKYKAGQKSSYYPSNKPNEYSVWMHTFRAIKYPELRYLGKDMWSELTRGLYDTNSLFYELTTKISQRFYFYDKKSVYSTLLRLLPAGLEPRDESARLRWKGFKDALERISKVATREISTYREFFRNSSEWKDSLGELVSKLSPTLSTEDKKKKIEEIFDRLWWIHLEGKNNQNIGVNYLVIDKLEYEAVPGEVQQRRDKEDARKADAHATFEQKVRYAIELLGEREVGANFEDALRFGLQDDLRLTLMSFENEITLEELNLIHDLVESVKKRQDIK